MSVLLSKVFKPLTRYRGNNIWPYEWTNEQKGQPKNNAFADIVKAQNIVLWENQFHGQMLGNSNLKSSAAGCTVQPQTRKAAA